MKKKSTVILLLLVAASSVALYVFWAKTRPEATTQSVETNDTVGGGSSSKKSAVLVHQTLPPTIPTQSVIAGASTSGRRSGGGRSRSEDVKQISPPQDMLAALRDALGRNATNDVSALLKMLRENPTAYTATIIELAQDETLLPTIRAMMLKLMGGLRDTASLDALVELSETLFDPILRAESVKALGQRPENDAEARLRAIADDPQDPARAMATSFLGSGADLESREVLTGQLTDPASSPELRNAALYAMRRYDDQATVATLMQTANDPSVSARERATALYSLGVIGDSNALALIKANLDSSDREVRYSATLAATRVSDPAVSAALVSSLCDIGNFPHVRKAASAALARNASPHDLDTLRRDVQTTDGFGIRLACDVFSVQRDTQAIPVLSVLAHSVSDTYVTDKIEGTINSLGREE